MVQRVGESTYYHSWDWLNYMAQFPGLVEFSASVEIDTSGEPSGVVIAAVTESPRGEEPVMAFPGGALGVPAVTSTSASQRRRVRGGLVTGLLDFASGHGARSCRLWSHPLTIDAMKSNSHCVCNAFEFQRYGLIPLVENTVVIDLARSESQLEGEISRYHRRHIRRQLQSGTKVRAYAGPAAGDALEEQFRAFEATHAAAAGRQTRVQPTWDAMLDAALAGTATLFVSLVDDGPASYLFCGEYARMAFGWSQANDPKLEAGGTALRHALEWEAIRHYQQRGFRFYEIGDRPFELQLLRHRSAKQRSIGDFKERYGGCLLPKVEWMGHADPRKLADELTAYTDTLASAAPQWLSETRGQ